jgi:FHA domain
MLLPRCGATFGGNISVAMRSLPIIATLIASVAAACLAAIVFADPAAAAVALTLTLDATRAFASTAWSASHQWAVENYSRTPALMVGLAALLVLPPLALASGLITRLALPRPGYATYNGGTKASIHTSHSAAPDHPSYTAWPREAWLTFEHQPGLRRSMPRELLSIGRGEDNDLVLDAATVHRYHAIIQRTPDALFLIKDLGGPGGNGVLVNDERVTEAHLLDADRLQLGGVTMVFHARRVGDSSQINRVISNFH